MTETLLRGRLLVASPALQDGNFDRTVVLVVEHNDEGALGVVLNRPSTTEVAEVLPRWAPLAADPEVVFVGGPVSPGAVICLAETAPEHLDQSWTPVVGHLGVPELGPDPQAPPDGLARVRLFAGYAGWAAGQLEGELEVGGWYVVDARSEDPLSPAPDELWSQVLRRQAGPLRRLAAFPVDPSSN
ncbi:MAG TPA: YqgE/AlgH family protein [Acidimicrobiales bacterium]|nr:YqgE/AlgH family protein [Acidimicrobiales bacterium]